MGIGTLLLAALAVVVLAYLIASVFAPVQLTQLGIGLERRISGLSTRWAHVKGFDMPYLEGGSGEALLLIHGFAGDKDNFTRVARFLTPHYRVIIPDLPGFGDATRDPQASYTIAAQVERLHALLGQLGVTRVHVGGNSMGGFIAAQFAATYPEMVGSVWLIDAAGTEAAHETPLMRHYEQTGDMPLLLRHERDFDRLLAATTHQPPFLPRFARLALGRRGAADYALHSEILHHVAASPLLEASYRDLPTPAFIVWGEHDQILHVNGMAALKALYRNAQAKVMTGLGHLPMAEAPRQTAQDYLAFRRSLAA